VLAWSLPEGAQVPDLVFIDPPYELIPEMAPAVFSKLDRVLSTKRDPVIVFEMPGEVAVEAAGWTCVKRVGRGARQPSAAFFRKAESI
jgi:16S rRNA (guanine966-N2)-methyltransferase